MNRTNWEHAVIALLLQSLFGLAGHLLAWFIGLPWLAVVGWSAGAAFAAGVFLGREIGQAEYRWIERFGGGRRANLPWWGMFDPRVWDHLDPWLDWITPTVAVIAFAGLAVVAVF